MMEDDDPHDHAHRGGSDATGELQRVPPARMFHAGRVPLEHGGWLDDARLSYQVWGTPAAAADNVVLMPTYYTGRHGDNARLVGAGRALDPARWCIVIPDMLGNGLSSSPSNTGGAQHGAGFPHVSLRDNVYLQRRLLVEVLGVERVRLVLGWSMGGMQAYQWASSYPDAVRAVLCICGAA
ncbi:MAG: alpha/beta fold hydrolase, partial [Gammaproteobacteria bacterium]